MEFNRQRRENFSLRSAIESWIAGSQASLAEASVDLETLRQDRDEALKRKLSHQEHRLNYENLGRELTYREAKEAVDAAHERLEAAVVEKNVAAAAVRFARIMSRQAQLDELVKAREAELADAKPVLDELHNLGANYMAALGLDLDRIGVLEKAANAALLQASDAQAAAQERLSALRDSYARTEEKLEAVKHRLTQRDIRRAALRNEHILQPDEKASAALIRWQEDQKKTEQSIVELETRIQEVDEQLELATKRIHESELLRRERGKEAGEMDSTWKRGDTAAAKLRKADPIREVLGIDGADLEFPDLLPLLHARRQELEDQSIQGRLDRVDDERTLHGFELDHLFPPSREVEMVLVHLRDCGLKTALPAYRFLANNAVTDGTARIWLANDPARFSGVIVTSEEEFASLGRGGFAVNGLRHPVQVTLSDRPDVSALTNEIAVALPTNDGAFNYESAAKELEGVKDRLEVGGIRIADIDARRVETVEIIRELCQWRGEFGGGALERLAAERDQIIDEIANIAKRITELNLHVQALRSERDAKNDALKQLRPHVGLCIHHQERLRSHVDEYERNEADWIAERHEKLTLLDQLGGDISAQERDVKRLTEDVDSEKERVRILRAQRQERINEQATIRFRAAAPAKTMAGLEVARTRYQTAVARYDERFGGSQLEGQIWQAESFLTDLRKEHHDLSGSLPADAIAQAALHPDLADRQAICERRHLTANSDHDAATVALQKAERNRPRAPAHKQGLGLPPGSPVPTTAAEAIACQQKLERLIELDDEEILIWKGKIADKEGECTSLTAGINARTPHLTTLEDLTEPGDAQVPALPEDDVRVAEIVAEAKRTTQRLQTAHEEANAVVTERLEGLQRVSRRPEFAAIPEIARDRLSAMPREELLQRCSEFIQSHEAWQRVLRNEIDTLAKDKDLVVRALDGVATAAVRLLARAERASLMPDSFPGWIGQPFLKISAHPVAEPAARRDRLAALVSRLISEKVLPTGHALASAALREIGGVIRATLLKPEDPLRPDRHDITEFKSFSGGERMTAAVLLYATLAQLRWRGRNEQSRDRAAGVLLLDNPFGTASKREFVDLQLRVARQMGVQLIYTTGVNDLGALDVLPRILRLRKHHRDRRSGDLLLSQETTEQRLEGVQANLRT